MKLLIVEENLDIYDVYRDLFEGLGWTISVCHTVEKALNQLLQFQPNVVLLDLELPNASAVSMLNFIRRYPTLSHIGVILISYDSRVATYSALHWDANAWLKKFACKEELYDALLLFSKSAH
jgi:DNA-binding response OmpR family regulator